MCAEEYVTLDFTAVPFIRMERKSYEYVNGEGRRDILEEDGVFRCGTNPNES